MSDYYSAPYLQRRDHGYMVRVGLWAMNCGMRPILTSFRENPLFKFRPPLISSFLLGIVVKLILKDAGYMTNNLGGLCLGEQHWNKKWKWQHFATATSTAKTPFQKYNEIRVLIQKYEKASILSIQKKYFSNYSWWLLCEYYFILIKPTGSNRFLFFGIIAKAYLKHWNILWGQEELDCIFLVSSLYTRYYHYW